MTEIPREFTFYSEIGVVGERERESVIESERERNREREREEERAQERARETKRERAKEREKDLNVIMIERRDGARLEIDLKEVRGYS